MPNRSASWPPRSTRCAPPTRAAGADGDTLAALHRQLERLEAVATRAAAASSPGVAGRPTSLGVAVVFDAPDRIANVGVRRRIFSGATRRAVEVRDRECYSEFWKVAAEGCQIDHVVPWAAGGLTTEHNGRPACAWHNRHRHRPSGPSP